MLGIKKNFTVQRSSYGILIGRNNITSPIQVRQRFGISFMRPLIELAPADMSNIERIVKQAIYTFSKSQTRIQFQENLSSLIQCMNRLTLSDVYVEKEFILNQDSHRDKVNPIIYIPVYEDLHVLVSIFILKSNSVIPLHDHPLMHGILKVLSGSVHIQSYSHSSNYIKQRNENEACSPSEQYFVEDDVLYPERLIVNKNSPTILSEQDNCGVLTPLLSNIHEVRSHNGPSAFIDVLAPPYNTSTIKNIGPRDCTYFEEVGNDNENAMLKRLYRHPDYWTKEIPFKGPRIRLDS